MSTTSASISDLDILTDVISPDQPDLSPESAQALLSLKFRPRAVERLNELAEKNRKGLLTPVEHADLERYLMVGNFLNLLQAKARKTLAMTGQ